LVLEPRGVIQLMVGSFREAVQSDTHLPEEFSRLGS
jgi:hypothetical protein